MGHRKPTGGSQGWSLFELASEPKARERISPRTPSVRAAVRSRRLAPRCRRWSGRRPASKAQARFLANAESDGWVTTEERGYALSFSPQSAKPSRVWPFPNAGSAVAGNQKPRAAFLLKPPSPPDPLALSRRQFKPLQRPLHVCGCHVPPLNRHPQLKPNRYRRVLAGSPNFTARTWREERTRKMLIWATCLILRVAPTYFLVAMW